MNTEIQDAKIRRERLMWHFIEGSSMDAASTSSGRAFLNEANCLRMCRQFREDKMYVLFEGLCRRIGALDQKALKALVGGKTLGSLAALCKENICYAQERIQWVRDDKYTWD